MRSVLTGGRHVDIPGLVGGAKLSEKFFCGGPAIQSALGRTMRRRTKVVSPEERVLGVTVRGRVRLLGRGITTLDERGGRLGEGGRGLRGTLQGRSLGFVGGLWR